MISIRGITKRFGPKSVLDGVDLEVESGETHVVLGRSGTGKSVLLKILCGILEPDAGSIDIGGERVCEPGRNAGLAAGRIQMLFQGGALFDSMTVAENVAFYATEHEALRPSRIDAFARPFLEMVDLPEAGPLTPAELSGGMRKRVALARALATKPRIMLYDEPTTGLDPLTSQTINELIRRTQQKHDVTSIVVTHDLHSASVVGDRVSFLHEGRVLCTRPMAQLSRETDPTVQAFIRDSGVPL